MKILFVYPRKVTFVENDMKILSEEHEVIPFEFPIRRKNRGKKTLRGFFSDLFKLKRFVRDVDLVYGWFADLNTFFGVRYARRYGKKSVIVAGGYDAAYLPDADYGLYHRKVRWRFAKYAFERSDLVIAVSRSIMDDLLKIARPRKVMVIYNGVDVTRYSPGRKEDRVLTVGRMDRVSIWRKGIGTFVEAARYMEIPFVVAGSLEDRHAEMLREKAPENVIFTGYLTFEELLQEMSVARVYVQVSAHEGFGMSLAEAMLCECVPVVTRRGAIPEVVGDTGFYVSFNDPEATAEAIRKALKSDLGHAARRRIMENFPLERRRRELLQTIGGLQ